MSSYIIIEEDYTVYKTKKINEDLKEYSDQTPCSIIDITNPEKPLIHFNDDWMELNQLDLKNYE